MGIELTRLVDSGSRIYSGQWIQFKDSNGIGFAQPDHYIVSPSGILLIECKLTQKARAWHQLRQLYVPLLAKIYDSPIICVQVCKNLAFDDGSITSEFSALSDGNTWHWLGR